MTVAPTMTILLHERVAGGLKRRAINRCSDWAEAYRIMGEPFAGAYGYKYHPWARDMHDAPEELVIGQKAAQMGFTEVALNKTFYNIDIKGVSVLYVLPASTPDASVFSSARFDPALELSSHLAALFSEVKNVHHKRAGNANLYIRGSRSRSQLKSLPVGYIVMDEIDEMVQEHIPLAMERVSGQMNYQVFMISTPTIARTGINLRYENSSQDHWFFKCPKCTRWIELQYPDCLVIKGESELDPLIHESYVCCPQCKGELPHNEKPDYIQGKWIPSYTNRNSRGFYINQLYSTTVKPSALAASYLRGLINPADEQEFYNSKLGLPHEPKGSRITDQVINDCKGSYTQWTEYKTGFITMGIDVGKWLHYEFVRWTFTSQMPTMDINTLADCQLVACGKVKDFEELDQLIDTFKPQYACIDANPETRKAFEFANQFHGRVKLVYYLVNIAAKQIHIHQEEEHTVSVNRTSWMDLALSRFRKKRIKLPIDLPKEYSDHLMAPVRIYRKDVNGNEHAVYVCGDHDPDHHAHARVYSEIAFKLGACVHRNENITGVL